MRLERLRDGGGGGVSQAMTTVGGGGPATHHWGRKEGNGQEGRLPQTRHRTEPYLKNLL